MDQNIFYLIYMYYTCSCETNGNGSWKYLADYQPQHQCESNQQCIDVKKEYLY